MSANRPVAWRVSLGDPVAGISWEPNGARIAVATVTDQLLLLGSADGAVAGRLGPHRDGQFRIEWSPDGRWLASSGQDGLVRIWDAATGKLVVETPAGGAWVEQLAWSPDGAWLAFAAGRTAQVMRSGEWRPAALEGQASTVSALSWRKDGKRLAVAAYGGVRVWDVEQARLDFELRWKSSLISLAWSPDGRWIVAGTQELAVQVWPLPFREGEELAMSGYPTKVRELAWHPSGGYLATGGGNELMVWDCREAGPAGREPKILQGHEAKVTALVYQRAGHLLASAGQDGRVLFWNVRKSAEPLAVARLDSPATDAAWSWDGKSVAVGTRGGDVALVNGLDGM